MRTGCVAAANAGAPPAMAAPPVIAPEIPGVLPRALSGEGFRRRRITCRFAGSQGRLRYL